MPLLLISLGLRSLLELTHVSVVGVSAPLAALLVNKLSVLSRGVSSAHVEADVDRHLLAVELLALLELLLHVAREILEQVDVELLPAILLGVQE